jgi:hypothetical protein
VAGRRDPGDWPDLDAGTKITVTDVRDDTYKEGLRRQRRQSTSSSEDDEPWDEEDD